MGRENPKNAPRLAPEVSMWDYIISSVVAQTSFLNTLIALYLCHDELPYHYPARAYAPRPSRRPPPRVVDVSRCRYRRRLLPSSAVVVGHHCCRRRPLPLSAVVVGRCRRRRRLLPSAVVVGNCHRLPLTSSYAAAVVYHCLRRGCCRQGRPLVMAEVRGSKLGVSGR